MTSILPFDELNAFNDQIRAQFAQGVRLSKQDNYEDILDELLDLFLLSYARANEVTNAKLSSDWIPSIQDVMETVNEKVAGKTWEERIKEWFDNGGTGDDIIRIAETESHRIANRSALDTAKKAGATKKTWWTMMDDKVRESHDYLLGVTVGIDDEFITFDGDRAQAPSMFSLPENNINCRCELEFE